MFLVLCFFPNTIPIVDCSLFSDRLPFHPSDTATSNTPVQVRYLRTVLPYVSGTVLYIADERVDIAEVSQDYFFSFNPNPLFFT